MGARPPAQTFSTLAGGRMPLCGCRDRDRGDQIAQHLCVRLVLLDPLGEEIGGRQIVRPFGERKQVARGVISSLPDLCQSRDHLVGGGLTNSPQDRGPAANRTVAARTVESQRTDGSMDGGSSVRRISNIKFSVGCIGLMAF